MPCDSVIGQVQSLVFWPMLNLAYVSMAGLEKSFYYTCISSFNQISVSYDRLITLTRPLTSEVDRLKLCTPALQVGGIKF